MDSAAAWPMPTDALRRLAEGVRRGVHARRSGLDAPDALARDAGAGLRESRARWRGLPEVDECAACASGRATRRPRGTWRRGSTNALGSVGQAVDARGRSGAGRIAGAGTRGRQRSAWNSRAQDETPGRQWSTNSRNCTNLPRPTDYLLMREELGIVRRDAVFERTLASAARLAYPPAGQS